MMERRAIWAAVAVVALLVVVAAPATARGKPKPADPPVLVDVTMNLVGAEGLTTECDDPVSGDRDDIAGAMLMELTSDGTLFPAEGVYGRLGLYVADVDVSRDYPVAYDDVLPYDGFSGCHGGNLDLSPAKYGGLGLTVDSVTGALTSVLWHYDYYVLETIVRKRTVLQVLEHFTLSGRDLTWDPATKTASGWFDVLYHREDRINGVSIGYVPVAGSPRYLSFTFTLTPHH